MNSFILELTRQSLRWLALYLIAQGLPPGIADLLGHPAVSDYVAGMVVYAIAESGWIVAKVREFRKWLEARKWRLTE